MRRAAAPLLLLALCAACATPHTVAEPAQRLVQEDITFGDDLRSAAVIASFHPSAPARLWFGAGDGLTGARAEPSGAALVPAADGGVALPRGTTAVRFAIDITRLPWQTAQRDALGVLVDPSALLCRPAEGARAWNIRATVTAPAGMRAAVPWTRADGASPAGVYEVPPSTFRDRGRIAVGRFRSVTVRSGSTDVECVLLGALRAAGNDVARAIGAAADAALPLAGDARPRRVLVLLRPAGSSTEPVLFGETFYGGGSTIQLLVGGRAVGPDLLGEWVAVHEMTHLALPRVAHEDAWFAEGLATYYQNVLRARAGLMDEQDAWDAFTAGMARGQAGAGGHTLVSDSRWMGERRAFLRVYWSGAAIALLWDVALRRDHDRTLDDALRAVARRFPPGGAPARAAAVIAAMDAWLGEPLFSRSAERWLASRTCPDLDRELRRLGIDGPFLDDDAPDAAIRRAITSGE